MRGPQNVKKLTLQRELATRKKAVAHLRKGRGEDAKHFLITNSARRKDSQKSSRTNLFQSEAVTPLILKNNQFPKRGSPIDRQFFPEKRKVLRGSGGSYSREFEVSSPTREETPGILLIKRINSKKPPSQKRAKRESREGGLGGGGGGGDRRGSQLKSMKGKSSRKSLKVRA